MVAGKTSSMKNDEGLDMAALHSLTHLPRPISLTLLGAAGILLANAYISYENTRRLQDANAWIVHSANVLEKSARVNAQLQRAGQAERGFLLTGHESFLVPYEAAGRQVVERLAELQSLTADNEIQQGRVNRLVALVQERLAQLESAIATYRERGAEAARETVLRNEERHLTDEVQALLGELRSEEEKTRDLREGELGKSTRFAAFSGMVAVAVGLSQLLLSWYVIAIYLERRRESEAELTRVNAGLEEIVQARTDDLSRLSRHLMTVREDEKAKIARELHDELGSNLTAARMDLAWVAQRVAENAPVAQRVARASDVVRATVDLGRRIIHDLRPPLLDDLGLSAAIEAHVTEFSKHSGLKVDIDVTDELPELAEGCPIALFRIMQEALTNILRYAQAGRVRVSLRREGNSVVLEITDDGIGLSDGALAKSMSHGLLGMRERAAQIGGAFNILRGAGNKGTVVRVTLPCVAQEAA
jgi:signal transduction histidine kinase